MNVWQQPLLAGEPTDGLHIQSDIKVACWAPKKVVMMDAQLAEQMVSHMAVETAVYLDDSLDKYSAADLDLL